MPSCSAFTRMACWSRSNEAPSSDPMSIRPASRQPRTRRATSPAPPAARSSQASSTSGASSAAGSAASPRISGSPASSFSAIRCGVSRSAGGSSLRRSTAWMVRTTIGRCTAIAGARSGRSAAMAAHRIWARRTSASGSGVVELTGGRRGSEERGSPIVVPRRLRRRTMQTPGRVGWAASGAVGVALRPRPGPGARPTRREPRRPAARTPGRSASLYGMVPTAGSGRAAARICGGRGSGPF